MIHLARDGGLTSWPTIRMFQGAMDAFRVLILLLSLGSVAHAASTQEAEICRLAFGSAKAAYVDLNPKVHEKSFIRVAREARADVIAKFGFLPELKLTQLADISDLKLFLPGVEKSRKNAIAYSSFHNVDSSTLEIEMIWVREDLRHAGLSKLLLSEILALHPEIDRIHVSDLVDTNLQRFENAQETLGKKQSIRETWVYRAYAAFGFTEIKKLKIVKRKSHEMSFGGEKYDLVLRHPAIRFDLTRPKQK